MASPYTPEFRAKVSQEYLDGGFYPFLAEKYNIGKTTIEERREIVSYCLEHGHNYIYPRGHSQHFILDI